MEKHRPNHEVKSNHLDNGFEKHHIHENDKNVLEHSKKNKENLTEEARVKAEQIFAQDNKNEFSKKSIENALDSKKTNETINKKPSKELKEIILNNELKHIQSRLSNVDKTGSRLIHLKGFRTLNELSSKTISRPFGLLGGGIAAFLGSLIYYFYSNHIGMKYNYFMIVVFFVSGYLAGLITEAIIKMLGFNKAD